MKVNVNKNYKSIIDKKLNTVFSDENLDHACRKVAERLRGEVSRKLPLDTGTARRSTRVIQIKKHFWVTRIAVDYASFIFWMGELGKEPKVPGTEPKILEIAAKDKFKNSQIFAEALREGAN